MGAIRFSGMASGLPANIVDQIMDAERIPVKTMEASKAKEDEKLKLVTDLEGKVNDITKNIGDLVGIRGFTNVKLTSGDQNVINGTVDPDKAVPGSYQVEVTQLAEKPGAMSTGFPDKDKSELGVGYIKFKTEQGEKEVYINGKNNTLDKVAATINNAQVGVRATVVNDRKDKENPFKLLVTGLATGDDHEVHFPTVYMLDGDEDFQFEKTKPAVNAKVKIDGFELELGENSGKDLIPGVTLDLKQANPGKPILVTIKEDYEAIGGKMKGFVDAYNGALAFIQGQHKLTKGPDGKDHLGPLGGDSLTRTIESSLRGAIINPQMGVGSTIQRVSDLGVEFNRQGTLEFKQDKFNAAINKNANDVAKFLHGDGFNTGFIPTVKRQVSNFINTAFGPIAMRKKGLQEKIDSINQHIDNKQRQLERKEESLRKQFSDLEGKMSQLQSQGAAVGGLGAAIGGGKGQ